MITEATIVGMLLNAPGKGTYGIEKEDLTRTEVPYTTFFKADNAITVEM